MQHRYPEIDLLRTIAIFLMVIYHILFDLEFLYGSSSIDLSVPFWKTFQVCSASLFLILVGISFVLSYQRTAANPGKLVYRKYLRRGLRIIGYGVLISLTTYIFDTQTYVRFGILHLIGVSVLVLPFFYRLKEYNIVIGILSICIGKYVSTIFIHSSLLLPFGITYTGFQTIDYFPLFPWFGVVLIGVAIGHFFFVRNPHWRTKRLDQFLRHRSIGIIGLPGRYSLLIYLIHQPLILLVLSLIVGKWQLMM